MAARAGRWGDKPMLGWLVSRLWFAWWCDAEMVLDGLEDVMGWLDAHNLGWLADRVEPLALQVDVLADSAYRRMGSLPASW